jgi:Mor family transcriptional regulator
MNATPNLRSVGNRAHPPMPLDPFADPAPPSLYNQIERTIGDHLADKLIADFGGQRLYIPHAPALYDRVTTSIGLRAALKMARAFGGDRIVVPVASDLARRRAQILTMRSEQLSISRIARRLRCSERYVYKILAAEHAAQPGDTALAEAPRIVSPRNPSLVATPASPAERFNGYPHRTH